MEGKILHLPVTILCKSDRFIGKIKYLPWEVSTPRGFEKSADVIVVMNSL